MINLKNLNSKKKSKKAKSNDYKGIEVGHIFYFGDKYSKPLNCFVDSQSGKKIQLKWVPMV